MCLPIVWPRKEKLHFILIILNKYHNVFAEQVLNQCLIGSFDFLIKIKSTKLLCNLAQVKGRYSAPEKSSENSTTSPSLL